MFAVQMTIKTINDFVRKEMSDRGIKSNREFGRLTGVNHQIINDLVNEKPRTLDLPTLVKLSNYTGMSLVTLLELAFPDALNVDLDIEARVDAEVIRKMPPNKRKIARRYITGVAAEGDDE